ncbi:hypothetical protein BG006_001763 [Podila minutissima]|uniref:Crinkler effector protein N-terminal domain-containing protein n=1 Tax=Podila minutissima TaxID=64525 RepID=A0A9P5SAH7_9FUNG|nr:hypothetical protein BG006_001763 [Podila minutissima]
MSDNPLKLFCVVDGETTPFPITIDSTKTIGDLKDLIKAALTPQFDDITAKDLILWRVIDSDNNDDETPIFLDNQPNKEKLRATKKLFMVFDAELPEDTIHVIVKQPPPDPQYLPQKKRIRFEEDWRPFTASDGTLVDLPPSWIELLASAEFVPEPRVAFEHLKGNLRAGDGITIPSMGQVPKEFGIHGQDHKLFVTEQMLELWEEMNGDQKRPYRRILSGPMGVGKSYLSYFLAAKAYAEGWLVLYISDAKVLDKKKEEESEMAMVKRFLALNKDILTGAELEMLVNDYDATYNISTDALSAIFDKLLMSRDRKTLLLVDEHGKLFEREPHVPDKFETLVPLSSFAWWGEDAKGSRLVFTGTAHAKYEMTNLPENYRQESVVFVGPLSRKVFSYLLDTYPRLKVQAIRSEVTEITNCVPRELVNLSAAVKDLPDPISLDNLQKWSNDRADDFLATALKYYQDLDPLYKQRFHNALLHTFLGSTSTVNFEWNFVDLGLIYRSKVVGQVGTQHHILCRPAQAALLELFKTLPLPDNIKKRIVTAALAGTNLR